MSFCDHCEGQRFDRARVLRSLREAQTALRRSESPRSAQQAITRAIDAVRKLDIPHVEIEEVLDGEVVH